VPPDTALPSGVAFRLPVDWARCEPVEGRLDEEAFEHYTAVLDEGHARGLLPVVVLHHLGHPRWLGDDFWLRLEAPARFAEWTAAAVTHLEGRCRHWVTVEEPNVTAVRSWLSGTAPPGRILAVGDLVRSLDHLLAAHVVAYGTLHGHRSDAVVATTVAASPLYELGALLGDVLSARAAGVGRDDLPDWLSERRRSWYSTRARPTAAEATVRGMARSGVPLEQALPRTLDAVWAGPHGRPLDDLAVELPHPDGAAAADGRSAGSGLRVRGLAAVGRTVEAAVLGRGGSR